MKDAMNVDLSLKKIDTLELEKKNLLIKLFDANELINVVKIECWKIWFCISYKTHNGSNKT